MRRKRHKDSGDGGGGDEGPEAQEERDGFTSRDYRTLASDPDAAFGRGLAGGRADDEMMIQAMTMTIIATPSRKEALMLATSCKH